MLYQIKGVLEHWSNITSGGNSLHLRVQLVSHHPPDDDDFGSQGSADSEDGHETEAEDHKVDAEEDFARVEQNSRQPEIEKRW